MKRKKKSWLFKWIGEKTIYIHERVRRPLGYYFKLHEGKQNDWLPSLSCFHSCFLALWPSVWRIWFLASLFFFCLSLSKLMIYTWHGPISFFDPVYEYIFVQINFLRVVFLVLIFEACFLCNLTLLLTLDLALHMVSTCTSGII